MATSSSPASRLFDPAVENDVPDHKLDRLVNWMLAMGTSFWLAASLTI